MDHMDDALTVLCLPNYMHDHPVIIHISMELCSSVIDVGKCPANKYRINIYYTICDISELFYKKRGGEVL